MNSILQPGFVYWDGLKYILTPGTPGPAGPQGPIGPQGASGISVGVIIVTDANYTLDDTTKNWVVGFQGLTDNRTFTMVSNPFLGQQIVVADVDGTAGSNLFIQSPADGNTMNVYRTTGGSSYSLAPTNTSDPLDAGHFQWNITSYGCSSWRWNGIVWSLETWTPRAGLTPP